MRLRCIVGPKIQGAENAAYILYYTILLSACCPNYPHPYPNYAWEWEWQGARPSPQAEGALPAAYADEGMN
jgi:hypothetical protein